MVAKPSIQVQLAFAKKKPSKKLPKMLQPTALERKYLDFLKGLLKGIKSDIAELVSPKLESLTAQASALRGDDWDDDLGEIIKELSARSGKRIEAAEKFLEGLALSVSVWNSEQTQKLVKSFFGVNIFTAEPWLADQLKAFKTQNIKLISTVSATCIDQVEQSIYRGVLAGDRHETIAGKIRDVMGVTDRRAKLIARDQVATMNSLLNARRQQALGVTRYVWRTSGDERVRPTHRANNGKTFFWDKPPSTGAPGQEALCRCVAEPVLEDIRGY